MLKQIIENYAKKIYHEYVKKDYRPLYKANSEKVNPWAYIRVKDEAITLKSCLNSIVPAISRGIIGYHDCSDGSEEIILEFCKRNTGFISHKYEHEIIPFNDHRYMHFVNDENTFSGYCNKLLSFIPKGDWLIKIDADHIYNQDRLEQFLKYPRSKEESIIITNLNLHCEENRVLIRKDYPITTGDHWLINNHDLYFDMEKKYIGDRFYCIERLIHSKRKRIFTDLINYHFTYLKKGKKVPYDRLQDFDIFMKDVLPVLPMGYLLPKEMLRKDKILEIYENFNF